MTYGLDESAMVCAVNVRAVDVADALTVPGRNGRCRCLTLRSACQPAWRAGKCAQRAGRDRRGHRNRADDAAIQLAASQSFRASPPLPALRRSRRDVAALYVGGRLWSPPGRDGRHAGQARGAFPGRRLVLAFQPHRYTARDCFEDFVKVIGSADAVLLAEVYAAGEAPIIAADGRALTRALRVAGKGRSLFVDDIDRCPRPSGPGPGRRCRDHHGRRIDRLGARPAQVQQGSRPLMGPLGMTTIDVNWCRMHFGQRWPCSWADSAERDVSLMSGTGVLRACSRSAWMLMPFDPATRRPGVLLKAMVHPLLHRLHGAMARRHGRCARTAGHPLHRLGRDGLSIAMDKVMTKRIWLRGSATPYVWLAADQSRARAHHP